MSTAPLPRTDRRWTLAPQFSLRTLLLAVLLCGAALAWWRRPYQVTFAVALRDPLHDSHAESLGEDGRPDAVEIRTMRRRLFASPVPSGPTRSYHSPGATAYEEHWAQGERDGPRRYFDPQGRLRIEEHWHRGKLHGRHRRWDEHGRRILEMEYAAGEAVSFDWTGSTIGAASCPAGEMLLALTDVDFVETPLDEIILELAERHRLPVQFDRRALGPADGLESVNVTVQETAVPVCLALYQLLEPRGLACVCRFDQLWITTRASATTWRDPTGVSELRPEAGSVLSDALSRQAFSTEFLEAPVQEFADSLSADFSLPIECRGDTRYHPGYGGGPTKVTLRVAGLSLRSILGIVCDQYGFYCEQSGDGLVLRPTTIRQ